MKIGLIVDRLNVARWQSDALALVAGEHQFIIYNCTTLQPRRRRFHHALYYVLNILALRNRMTRGTALPARLKIAGVRSFEPAISGAWQELPAELLETMREDAPAVIVKFGMGLLRVPPPDVLPAPIISYHHGDSTRFRGRPAGFYELLQGERTIGQVVQILGEALDAGVVVASAETRVIAHSYKATLVEAYRHSPLLLRGAIENAAKGSGTPPASVGRNYRLPDNQTVLRLVGQILAALRQRLIYGALFEKDWMVATSPSRIAADLPLPVPDEPSTWTQLAKPAGYRFIADPFPHPGGDGVLVEALHATSGQGEIVHISAAGARLLCSGPGHFSYPAPFRFADEAFLLPEVSEWSPSLLYQFEGGGLSPVGELRVAGSPRLIDPTVHSVDGRLFLFANRASEAGSVLRLWTSASLSDEFVEHSRSPIRISPLGSRMAGAIIDHRGQLYRVGQDLRGQYGDGIALFRIEALTPDDYREVAVGELRFSHCRGPHTLNATRDGLLFDYYEDRFALLAGVRRLRSSVRKRFRLGKIGTAANIASAPRS